MRENGYETRWGDRQGAPSSPTLSFYVCLIHEKPALELNPAESLATTVLINATVILVEC